MQIIVRRRLREFWDRNPRSEHALREWYAIASRTEWDSPEDVKAVFGKGIDFVGGNRIIFDIRRNEFRLVVHVAYAFKRVLIKFIGTHAEYDRIDLETVT